MSEPEEREPGDEEHEPDEDDPSPAADQPTIAWTPPSDAAARSAGFGAGPFGVERPHLATPEDGGEPVALKVVTTELSQDDVFLRRFRREVKAAQKIEHPNVVPIYDVGEAEGGSSGKCLRKA